MILAHVVLFGSPILILILFWVLSAPTAVVVTIIGGYLFLPEQIILDLPGFPALTKSTIPALMAVIMVTAMPQTESNRSLSGWFPRQRWALFLLLLLFVGSFPTVFTNNDPLSYGPTFLPALRHLDAFSNILTSLAALLPFLLGRKMLAFPEGQRLLLNSFVIFGVIYSFPTLYEVRMSPQLNQMVYGFFPHSFLQHIRASGFRPIVFLNHGLWLAIFFFASIIAACAVGRLVSGKERLIYFSAALWLLATLVLSNSLGALIISLLLLPVIMILGRKQINLVAMGLSLVVLLYPMLRSADLMPIDQIINWAAYISPDRAASFQFRVANEDILLEKARERIAFGWGGWGRNFVFNEEGRDISVSDGYWILIIGQGGWMRYLAEFGLLCLPAVLVFLSDRRYQIGFESAALALILSGCVLDLIPNGTITPWTWLLAGAVWGRLEAGRVSSEIVHSTPQHREMRYTRVTDSLNDPQASGLGNREPSQLTRFPQTSGHKQRKK